MKIQPLIILSLIGISLHAEHQHTLKCRHWNSFHWPVDTSVQRYGPQRQVDILDLSLGDSKFWSEESRYSNNSLQDDAMGSSRTSTGCLQPRDQSVRWPKIEYWENTDRELVITFEQPIPPKKDAKISIVYEAEPIKGLYFRTPELG